MTHDNYDYKRSRELNQTVIIELYDPTFSDQAWISASEDSVVFLDEIQ